MSEPTTVRDIEWHVSTAYLGGFVYAEDQYLFPANRYAQQVVDEHNSYLAMRERLRALVSVEPGYNNLAHYWFCCGSPFYHQHKADCPWLLAKQLLDGPTIAPVETQDASVCDVCGQPIADAETWFQIVGRKVMKGHREHLEEKYGHPDAP